MEKTEIKKIVLDLDGKEVVLTVNQAKKLKDILSDLFGKEVIKEIIVDRTKYYDWSWGKPYYYDTSTVKFTPNKFEVMCKVATAYDNQPKRIKTD